MKRTMAERLGSTPHLSPLLRKMRGLGLLTPDALLRLAVRRGCTHYAPPEGECAEVDDPGPARLSDLELAFAMCSGSQVYDPTLVRCAAELISSVGENPDAIVRLARMERSEAIIAHVARAGVALDVGHESFWQKILSGLRVRRPVPIGVLPDSSRFALQTGIVNPRRPRPKSVWLRRSLGSS